MPNTIDLEFADGEYTFALPLPRIDELQHKTHIGIGGLYQRLLKGAVIGETGQAAIIPHLGEFYALDIVETVRQGLIGGGKGVVNGAEVRVTPELANRLIENYVLTQPLASSWPKAVMILAACIVGYDPPKKDEPPLEGAAEEPTVSSTTA
jgi:hypothetical protein